MSSVGCKRRGFEQIQELIAKTAADFLGSTFEDPRLSKPNSSAIDVANLNSLRLHVIRQMNTQLGSGSYFQLAKLALEILLAMNWRCSSDQSEHSVAPR